MQATVWDVRCFFFSLSSFLWDLKLRLKKQQLFIILSPSFFFFAPFLLTVNSDPSDQNQRKFHVRHWECLKPAGWWSEHEDVIVGLRPTCLILSPISSSEVCCISHQQSEHVVLWDNKSLINKLLPSCDWSPGPRRLLASVPEIPSGPDRQSHTLTRTFVSVCGLDGVQVRWSPSAFPQQSEQGSGSFKLHQHTENQTCFLTRGPN